jgi:tetratricopeptide (TPR) repeat protein
MECGLLGAPPVRRSTAIAIAIACGPVSAEPSEPDRALARSAFAEAFAGYRMQLERAPFDHHALREAGRAAHALHDFAAAADLLARADAVAIGPDPELHFLLGEAYWELGRDALAIAAHRRARTELGAAPGGRLERLWLARIAGRLGDRAAADAIYDAADPGDAEAAFAQTEMHGTAGEWEAADRAIRRYLARDPSSPRARALLAWIDEGRGLLADEVATRAALASARDADKDTVRDYGRALERAGDWAGARDAYGRAADLPGGANDVELAAALERVDQRMSIEIGAGSIGRSDPVADSIGAFTGIALPYGRAHHLALVAWGEHVTSGARTASIGDVRAATTLHGGGGEATVGVHAGRIASGPIGGVSASALSAAWLGHVKAGVDGELHGVWRDAPFAELLGGRVDAITAHLYLTALDDRVVVDTGAQGRAFQLAGDASARQGLAWAGADVVVWRDFSHEASGQILDDDLQRAATAADAAVLGYRHYEVVDRADAMFDAMIALAPRASVDEVSATARKVVASGRVAGELRGGLGHDWVTARQIARAGASLWIAPSRGSRLALGFDIAKESVQMFVGVRRTGWVSYHVDL